MKNKRLKLILKCIYETLKLVILYSLIFCSIVLFIFVIGYTFVTLLTLSPTLTIIFLGILIVFFEVYGELSKLYKNRVEFYDKDFDLIDNHSRMFINLDLRKNNTNEFYQVIWRGIEQD